VSVLKTLSGYEFAFEEFCDSLRFHGKPALSMDFYCANTLSLSRRAFARIGRPAPSNCPRPGCVWNGPGKRTNYAIATCALCRAKPTSGCATGW
jgi:hypothetical protein